MSPKTAFITDCGGGKIHPVRPWRGDGNCVEGLACVLGADIFQGCELPAGGLCLDYEVYLVNGNSTLWWLPKWLQRHGRRAVLLWEGGIENYYQGDSESRLRLRQCFDACVGLLTHGPTHAAMIHGLHPKVGWLGCPIPPPQPPAAGGSRWLNAPVALHRGLPGALLLQELKIQFVQYAHDNELPAWESWLVGAEVEYRSLAPHADFLAGLREFGAVLNWDPCATAGRHVIDCSAAGVPCLSSETTAAAAWLPFAQRLPPPPHGRAEVIDRLLDREWMYHPMPYFNELRPEAIRKRWEEFCHDL